mmetsp:Transcript_6300/g.12372  ORF Transcript_6300/g.12372 Transcript_6300/m.12372 type:complete len:85 (+) Transcript_6300:494-748(+)
MEMEAPPTFWELFQQRMVRFSSLTVCCFQPQQVLLQQWRLLQQWSKLASKMFLQKQFCLLNKISRYKLIDLRCHAINLNHDFGM